MFHREVLRPEADALFSLLAAAPELDRMTLMGGTALALQIGHRRSLDFDFAVFGQRLPSWQIEQLHARLKADGHQAMLTTTASQMQQFKINSGLHLLDYARDYVINGVKVTFFAHGRTTQQKVFYEQVPKVPLPNTSFNLMGIDGLKAAKTLVLGDRVRSRDLYDLMILVRDYGYSLEQLFDTVTRLGTVDDPEAYKAIMRGETPLDSDDEGLEPVHVTSDINGVYAYFNEIIDRYEIDLARRAFSGDQQ